MIWVINIIKKWTPHKKAGEQHIPAGLILYGLVKYLSSVSSGQSTVLDVMGYTKYISVTKELEYNSLIMHNRGRMWSVWPRGQEDELGHSDEVLHVSAFLPWVLSLKYSEKIYSIKVSIIFPYRFASVFTNTDSVLFGSKTVWVTQKGGKCPFTVLIWKWKWKQEVN